jgi:hypothetical protein
MTASARLLLAIPLCASLLALLPSRGLATDFPDVPKWHWAWPYVQGVSDAGITTGYPDGTYQPSLVVARDQMAVYVARALAGGDLNVPSGPATPKFVDVGTDHWAYKYVEYCADPARDVVRGYGDSTYRPTLSVNRAGMAVYIARALAGGDAAVPPGPPQATFTDVDAGYWAFQYIEYCAEQDAVQGYPDGSYRPELEVSRDQMAVYICRAFDIATPSLPYNITDYLPLDQGNSWAYDSSGGFYTLTVSGTGELRGQAYARLVLSPGDQASYWRAQPEGLFLGGASDPALGTLTVVPPGYLPNGLDPGDQGSQAVDVYLDSTLIGQASFSYHFVGVEPATVPAGAFPDCMKLEIQIAGSAPGSGHYYAWLAKGVGLVKADNGPMGGSDWAELVTATVAGASYPAAK